MGSKLKRAIGLKLVVGFWLALIPLSVSAQTDMTPPAVSTDTMQVQPGDTPGSHDYSYVLGPLDVVHIEALNHPDFNVKAPIGADGTIQLPYIGSLVAANLTTSALRSRISDELKKKGIFSNISLQVDVISYASRSVIALGGVANPGLIFLDRAYRVSEILARAGGVRPGSSEYVVLRSANGTERKLAIGDVATGDNASDPLVTPGDKIYVPMEVFYIKGQVKTPGAYPLTLDMTLAMALARGGGLTDLGSANHISIDRHGVEIKPDDLNFKVKPDDVVDVGESWF